MANIHVPEIQLPLILLFCCEFHFTAGISTLTSQGPDCVDAGKWLQVLNLLSIHLLSLAIIHVNVISFFCCDERYKPPDLPLSVWVMLGERCSAHKPSPLCHLLFFSSLVTGMSLHEPSFTAIPLDCFKRITSGWLFQVSSLAVPCVRCLLVLLDLMSGETPSTWDSDDLDMSFSPSSMVHVYITVSRFLPW